MPDIDFGEGTIVELISGGPQMVVREISDDGKVLCEWCRDKKIVSHRFAPNTLICTPAEELSNKQLEAITRRSNNAFPAPEDMSREQLALIAARRGVLIDTDH